MGLANRLNEIATASEQKNVACSLGQLKSELSKEDAEALDSALNSPASTRSIHEALRAEGFKIDRASVTLHRKGFCRCKESDNE